MSAGNDEVLKILIEFGLNDEAAKQAAVQIDQLGASTKQTKQEADEWERALKKAGKETEEFNVHSKAMKVVFHELDHIIPGVGKALHQALAGAGLAAGAFALVGVIRMIQHHFEELNATQQKILQDAQSTIGSVETQYARFAAAVETADKAMSDHQQELERRTKRVLELLEAEKAAVLALTPDANKPGVEKTFEKAKIDELRKQMQEEMHNLVGLTSRSAAGRGGLSQEDSIARMAQLPEDIKRITDRIAEIQKKLVETSPTSYGADFWKEAAAGVGSLGMHRDNYVNKYEAFLDAQTESLTIQLTNEKSRLEKLKHQQVSLGDAKGAEAQADTLQKSIQALSDQIDKLRAGGAASQMAGSLTSAIDLSRAHPSGSGMTQDQQQLVMAVAQFETGQRMNLQQSVQLLRVAGSSQDNFNAVLHRLETHLLGMHDRYESVLKMFNDLDKRVSRTGQ